MFGIFKKSSKIESDGYNPDKVIVHYLPPNQASNHLSLNTYLPLTKVDCK